MIARASLHRATGFIAATAGPSRLSVNTPLAHAFRSASTSAAPPPPRTPTLKARPTTPFAPRAARLPLTPASAPTRLTAWPWRPSASSPAGFTDLERTIYARPFEGPLGNRVRMLWFLVPFWGLVVGFYLTTPVPLKQVAEGESADPVE
jgi:hypothetical protein